MPSVEAIKIRNDGTRFYRRTSYTFKEIHYYMSGGSSWSNLKHVHRLVIYVAKTSHTTQNALPTFSLCNHFPIAKNRSNFSSQDTFHMRHQF